MTVDVSALIADLVRAGTDPELVGRVAAALSEREAIVIREKDEAAERRRERDRDRKRSVRGLPQTSAESADTPPPEAKVSPGPPSKTQPPTSPPSLPSGDIPPTAKSTPRENLLAVLDAEHAAAVIEHRQRIRSPLTPHAAKLLAGKFGRCDDPNAAADAMIAAGWRGFEPEWLDGRSSGPGPPPRGRADGLTGFAAVRADLLRDFDDDQDDSDHDDYGDDGPDSGAPELDLAAGPRQLP